MREAGELNNSTSVSATISGPAEKATNRAASPLISLAIGVSRTTGGTPSSKLRAA